MMTSDVHLSIREMSDRQAIQLILSRYAIALDSRALDALDDCFAVGAVIELIGLGVFTLQDYKGLCEIMVTSLDATQHLVATVVIQIEGSRAHSRCYSTAHHLRNSLSPGHLLTVGGQYDDEWEFTALGWRISRRTATIVWIDGNPAVLGLPAVPGGTSWTESRGFPEWLRRKGQ